jgi:hypothetical protein
MITLLSQVSFLKLRSHRYWSYSFKLLTFDDNLYNFVGGLSASLSVALFVGTHFVLVYAK